MIGERAQRHTVTLRVLGTDPWRLSGALQPIMRNSPSKRITRRESSGLHGTEIGHLSITEAEIVGDGCVLKCRLRP